MAIRGQQDAERGTQRVDLGVLEETALAMAQATIQNAMDRAQLTRAQLAQKLDCPKSFITRILSGNHNLTIRTFARVLGATGEEVLFQPRPICEERKMLAAASPRPTGRARSTSSRGLNAPAQVARLSLLGR